MDMPYYVEVEAIIYPSQNRFQVPFKYRANVMRDPNQVGFKTGVEFADMNHEMNLELRGAVEDFKSVFGKELSGGKIGTEEPDKPPVINAYNAASARDPTKTYVLYHKDGSKEEPFCPICAESGKHTKVDPVKNLEGAKKYKNPYLMCYPCTQIWIGVKKDGSDSLKQEWAKRLDMIYADRVKDIQFWVWRES
jgi:hypothetical protein